MQYVSVRQPMAWRLRYLSKWCLGFLLSAMLEKWMPESSFSALAPAVPA